MNTDKRIFLLLANDKKAIGSEVISVTTSSKSLAAIPTDATYALIQIQASTDEVNCVRMWLHGVAPTASVGLLRGHLDVFDLNERHNLEGLRFIKATGAPTTVNLCVQYFK